MEFQSLSQALEGFAGDRLLPECWSWNDSKRIEYTTKKYYDLVHKPIVANPLLTWMWKSCCTMSIKMFAWLVIMDRVNTKDMIQRRHWRIEDGPKCVLCRAGSLEDRNHLFFECNFSTRIWNYLQIY